MAFTVCRLSMKADFEQTRTSGTAHFNLIGSALCGPLQLSDETDPQTRPSPSPPSCQLVRTLR